MDSETEKLWKQLKLEEKEVLIKKPDLMEQVKKLVGDYEDVFKTEAVWRYFWVNVK